MRRTFVEPLSPLLSTSLPIALALTLGAATAHADPPANAGAAIRVMTLPEAIAHARAHQPAIRAAMARVAAEEQSARIPRAQWLPSVGVTAQLFAATANNTTGTYLGAPYVDVPRIGGTKVASPGSLQPYPTTFVGAGINQEIFDFGRIAAQAAAADAVVDVARQRAASERLEVDFAVEEAYFAVHAAHAVLRASEEARERSRVHRDLAKAAVDAGLRSPVELTRAEADLSRFDLGRERARASVMIAESVFAATVGSTEAALEVPAEMPATRDMPSMAEAIQQAAARDPRILEAEARLRAQEQATRAIGAELRPNAALSSSISARAGGAPPSSGPVANQGGWVPNIPNWDVGVVVSWPIFNGPTAARQRASRAREDVQREELGLVRFQRTVAIQQAYVSERIAAATLPALERTVAAARANYEQVDARFKAGVSSGVELADAEALRAQAEIELALGRFELARTRIAFGRAIAEEP
jgi:outer membrane protein TolC